MRRGNSGRRKHIQVIWKDSVKEGSTKILRKVKTERIMN